MKKYIVVYGTVNKRYFVTDSKSWFPECEKRIASYNNYVVALEVAEMLDKYRGK